MLNASRLFLHPLLGLACVQAQTKASEQCIQPGRTGKQQSHPPASCALRPQGYATPHTSATLPVLKTQAPAHPSGQGNGIIAQLGLFGGNTCSGIVGELHGDHVSPRPQRRAGARMDNQLFVGPSMALELVQDCQRQRPGGKQMGGCPTRCYLASQAPKSKAGFI